MEISPVFSFIVGLMFSIPIIMWSLMNLDSKVANRTVELEQELEDFRNSIGNKSYKISKLEKELSQLSLENDRLNLKYQRLLSETENIFNDN